MSKPKIAVVVPTVRPESFETFLYGWNQLFHRHEVLLIEVRDGDDPKLHTHQYHVDKPVEFSREAATILSVMGTEFVDLIFNKNDGVRNLGFAYVAKYTDCDIVITLDDDVLPVGDTIQDHIDALNKSYPTSWINTTNSTYMRGFPYWIRDERECVISHGVWTGTADFDASTQLVLGVHDVEFYKGPIPKDILFPMCIMNVAFKREFLPYMYQAPMAGNINRFADIWGGVFATKEAHFQKKAIVTGYATIHHTRASDPFVNLIKEAVGIGMHEFLTNPNAQPLDASHPTSQYFEEYEAKRGRWRHFTITSLAERISNNRRQNEQP